MSAKKCPICRRHPLTVPGYADSWCWRCNDAFHKAFPDGVAPEALVTATWAARRARAAMRRKR